MALMTEEDRAALPKGVYLSRKCDNCSKPIGGFLSYNGSNGAEYCSNGCFEEGEGQTRGKIQTQRSQKMIETKATSKPQGDEKQMKPGASNKMDAPSKDKSGLKKKKKKHHSAPTPEPEPEKKAKTPSAPEPDKKKAKTAVAAEPSKKAASDAKPAKDAKPQVAPGKAGKGDSAPKKSAPKGAAKKETPYREGTGFAAAFKRLMTGKAMTVDQMFDGLEAGDPGRMTAHMIRRGDETGEFTIKRLADGKLQMTKIYGK